MIAKGGHIIFMLLGSPIARALDPLLRMTLYYLLFFPQYVASIAGFFFAITRIAYALGYYTGGKPVL